MEQLKIKLKDIDRVQLVGGTTCRTAKQVFDSLADKPDYIINAGMYDTKSGLTVCDTIINGVLLNGGNYTDKGFSWNHKDLAADTTAAAKKCGVEFFLGGSPSLVWAGKVCIEKKGFNNWFLNSAKSVRIGMGITNDDELVFCFPAAAQKLNAFAKTMLTAGCRYAINLDGGGSTRVMQNVNGKLQRLTANNENRANSTWLLIYLKKQNNVPDNHAGKKIVWLDAGHGGKDPGAVGSGGTQEKTITLKVTQRVKTALERIGVEVMETRTNDTHVTVEQRAKQANKAGADGFVSIHCNSVKDNTKCGTETYAYSKTSKGYQLAQDIHGHLISATGLENRGVKTASFVVLNQTTMPAALVEMAFISNKKEELLLNDGEWQQKVAEAIAHGVADYLSVKWVEEPEPEPEYNLKIVDDNGKETLHQIEQENRNGTVWVPVRQLTEALGFKVEYDSKEKCIVINE